MDSLVYIIVGVIGFAILIVIFVAIKRLKKKITKKEKDFYRQKWQEVKNDRDLKNAVMSADKLLEMLLRRKSYHGTLGEMLKQGKKEFSDLNGIWFAHKIRNKLAHELDYQPSFAEARKALNCFQKALQDLGAF